VPKNHQRKSYQASTVNGMTLQIRAQVSASASRLAVALSIRGSDYPKGKPFAVLPGAPDHGLAA
jgi:hypothetical protein